TAFPTPSPHSGSNATAALPQASHPDSHNGSAIRGCEANLPDAGITSATWSFTSRLPSSGDSADVPTEVSQAAPSPTGNKNNPPPSRYSIHHASSSDSGFS